MIKRLKFSLFDESICKECDGCKERHEGCHGTCMEYLKAKLVSDLLRVEYIKEQNVREDVRSYQIKRLDQKIKYKHPSTRYGKAGKRR